MDSAHWRFGLWFQQRCHGDVFIRSSSYRNLTQWIMCEEVETLRNWRRSAIHFLVSQELDSDDPDSICNAIPILRVELRWLQRSLSNPMDTEANTHVNWLLAVEGGMCLVDALVLRPPPEEEAYCENWAAIPVYEDMLG
jgi:hypothetical protein